MPYPLDTRNPWKYQAVEDLLGGINSSESSDKLKNNQTITLNNVLAKAGALQSDTGYIPLATGIRGTAQLTFEFFRRDTTSELMLVSTGSVYVFNSNLGAWLNVRGTATTTTSQAYQAGAHIFNVASSAGFSINDFIALYLDNGSQLQTKISAINGNLITTIDSVPVGRVVNNGAVFDRQVMLAGSLDFQVSADTIPGSDWFVFTNGVDTPKYFDGTHCIDIPNLPSAGNTTCIALAVYNTALFLFNTTEGGVHHAQRVRRSDQTDPTNWTTGTSGFDDLLDVPDPILSASTLGPYLIVYRDRSIVRGSFIGQGGLNYFWETMIVGEGALSSGAVAEIGDSHIVVGHAGIYEYFGDYALQPISDNIFYGFFGIASDLSPSYTNRLFSIYIPEIDEVWICYPTTSSIDNTCDKILRYNISEKFWYNRKLANNIVGFGFYTDFNLKTWLQLQGSWTQQAWTWASRSSSTLAPVLHLCASTGGAVYVYDYISTLDNGTPIAYTVETKDFTLPDAVVRFDMIEMLIAGTGVLLEYSTDQGYTWNTMATITQNKKNKVQVYKQITVKNSIRFRWSGNSADFYLEWFGFSYKVESLY